MKAKRKHSNLVLPDPTIDNKYRGINSDQIKTEIKKCANGIEGLKHFINEYIYVPNKIQPKILIDKPHQFEHLIFEGDKINLKLYAKQEEYIENLQDNRLVASYKSRQCLLEGSIVYTPNGSKKIQDLTIGDCVYSFNEETNEIEVDIVNDVWCSGIQPCQSMKLSNGLILKQGSNHPFLLANDEQKRSDELCVGDQVRYFNVNCSQQSIESIIDISNIENSLCYDIETFKNKNFIFEGCIVHNTGISTITQAYILWYSLFNDNKEIVIVSKSEKEAIKFLDSIYFMYNHLPFFLRRPFDKAVTKSFHLGNKNNSTKITVLTSTTKSGRSFSATMLILDECLKFDSELNIIDEYGHNRVATIEEVSHLVEYGGKNIKVQSYDGTAIIYKDVLDANYTGTKQVFRYESIHGIHINCTSNHPILTEDGTYRSICDCSYIPTMIDDELKFLPITNVVDLGYHDTYNLTVKDTNTYIVDNIITHNCEFIDHADTLQGAAQPTLSATGGQAILISTPWLYKSQFWGVCHDDNEETNAFNVFKIHQNDIPGRDRAWYEAQCKELKYDRMKIMTELDMQWIIPYTKYFNDDWLREEYVIKKKNYLDYNINYDLALIREYDPNISYYFGIDTYEEGDDWNAGTIVGSDNRIYAFFKTKRTDIFDMVIELCEAFHTKANVERNRGFQLIKEFIDKGLANQYLLYKIKKYRNVKEKVYGYNVGENRKTLLTYVSEYLKSIWNFNSDETNYSNPIQIPEEIMNEMRYFVFKKSRVEGLEHDDLIFSLIAALFVRNNTSQFSNYIDHTLREKKSGLERTKEFYGMLNDPKRKRENIKKQLTKNVLARNMISDIFKDKQLTKEQLDLLETVIDSKPNRFIGALAA